MKKLFIITALLLFAGLAFGQTLQKGNLIGVHVVTVDLKAGATMDQYIAFFNEKAKPVWENADKEMKIFPLKAIRGENANKFGMLIQYKNEAARDKYYNADGSATDFGMKFQEKIAPVAAEMEKIGTWTSTYTDWVIQ
jgi:hypothetical protein